MSRTRIALFAIAGLITLGTQAQAATGSQLTREQVRAEYFKARDEGRLPPMGENGNISQLSAVASTVTRAEVLRELAANGPIAYGEGRDADVLSQAKSLQTREAVRAQAIAALRSGAIVYGER